MSWIQLSREMHRNSFAFLIAIVLLAIPAGSQSASGEDMGMLIRVSDRDAILVDPVQITSLGDELKHPGLLVWSEKGKDRWQFLPTDRLELASDVATSFVALVSHNSRGDSSITPSAMLPPTTQLVQLVGQVVLRGSSFITPPDKSLILDGRITIRRRAGDDKSQPFPPDQLNITRNNRVILRLSLDDGEQTLRWSGISGLPEALVDGLPPGEYNMRATKAGTDTSFRIATADARMDIMASSEQAKTMFGKVDDAVSLQITVETLLGHQEMQTPRPLLVDAFDLLDRADGTELPTKHLRSVYADIRNRLEGKKSGATEDPDATGIESIDLVRNAIDAGRWKNATELLDGIKTSSDPRTHALSVLYRAVVLAESGQSTADLAEALFFEAIELLEACDRADQLRAHNNFGTFLLNRCQDRLYNHAFQMASGVQHPLVASLLDWHQSREQLELAITIAAATDPKQVPAIRVNIAHLFSTLADIIRVLQPISADGAKSPMVRVAESQAEKAAEEAARETDPVDGLIPAVGEEILAHLALRRGDSSGCLEHADRALATYLDNGSLAGCESIYRLRGLLLSEVHSEGSSQDESALALDELLKSQMLTEILRERIPADQTGRTSAGFFARHAYVNERIVELLVELKRDSEALQFAESAKARALQDVLSANRHLSSSSQHITSTSSDALLDWPSGTAALEYFIGSEKTWLFAVSCDGKVKAFVLQDDEGQPIASRVLIAKVHDLITRFDRLGPVEGRRIAHAASGSGKATFDHAWQDDLFWFYNTLVPGRCRELLHSADSLVIVPHHILHYFPFAALVTELDTSATAPTLMPLPRFFVEEPFSIVNAPSLGTWRLLRQQMNRPLSQVNIIGIADFGGHASNLPGVRTEIENLQHIFGDKINGLISNEDATETNVNALLGQPGILSISTHGQKTPDQPLDAYLVCQSDENNDGYLRASEIYEMDVEADLVLLNACYGGFADRSPMPGDDLFGIQRALLHGGARTVISGLWDIYDATAPDIMNDFWVRIGTGTSAPRALAEAQRAYLKTWREFPQEPLRFLTHPYYWAVFTVAGDDRTGGVTAAATLPDP
ncbi:MAG: CHAT domain-containing protein [Planctomycetaceae bacterium]|nr:CHAT domain-containing protein [Planctomycetaceae bacterium]